MIGTTEWVAAQQAARSAAHDAARAALGTAARAAQPNDWLMAPCNTARTSHATHGYSGDRWHAWDAVTGCPVRHVPHGTFDMHRITRREHILYVRRAAAQRRIDGTEAAPTYAPLAWLLEDVHSGAHVGPTAAVTETTRYAPQTGEDGRTRYRTARLTAPGSMVMLETLTRSYRRVRQGYSALMAHEASGEGRGTVQEASRIPGAVNGTETRVMPRWTPSKRRLITTVTEDGRTVPADFRCYRVHPDGTREALVSAATARKRKAAAAVSDAAAERQARADAAAERTRERAAEIGAERAAEDALTGVSA